MNQYHDYCLEDFVLDARFQQWVRYQQPTDSGFWETYIENNPQQSNDIKRAQTLLQSVYHRYESRLDDAEIAFEIQKLVTKARASKSEDQPNNIDEAPIVTFSPQKRFVWVWRVAAAIVLGLSWWYWTSQSPVSQYEQMVEGQSLIEKTNQTTQWQAVTLSDGSKVMLEPNARLSFAQQFSPDKREVYLSGSAFFEVTKDPKRPFLVYANELVTKVIGTSFMIKAPDNEQETTVEVKEGRVSVFRKTDLQNLKTDIGQESKGLVLTANQKVVFESESSRMTKTLRDTPEIVTPAAELPSFEFRNTPVSEVLTILEKAYQVDILFDEELLAGCPLTATLTDQPLFEKLTIICQAIEAQYEVLDGQIVVQSKGCKND